MSDAGGKWDASSTYTPPPEPAMFAFVHVPKAGGSTLKRLLIAWCTLQNKDLYGHSDSFLELPAEAQQAACGKWGHMGWGMHTNPLWKGRDDVPIRYITVLRDPVPRMVSQYYFEQQANVKFNRPTLTIEDWWGHEHDVSNRPWSVTQNPNIQQLCCYWDDFDHVANDECPPTRATLECAKRNLATFTVIGIQDEYGMFLQLLQARLGITLVQHMNKEYSVNVRKPSSDGDASSQSSSELGRTKQAASVGTPNGTRASGGTSTTPVVPDEMLRKFEESSRLDKELYEYARILFWKQAKVSLGVDRPY